MKKSKKNIFPPTEINCIENKGKKILFNVDLLRINSIKKEKQFYDINDLFDINDTVDEDYALTKSLSEPVIITKIDDKYEVLDGKHRVYRAKNEGIVKIEAYFYEIQELDEYILN